MANSWERLVEQVIQLQEDPEFDATPPPAFQWYLRKWMGDKWVGLMSMEARGIHHHLINVAWDERPPCSLSVDELELKGLCHHPPTWDESWAQVSRAWKLYEERWWQIGLVRSYLDLMARRGPLVAAGKRGAAKRWEGHSKLQKAKGEMAKASGKNGSGYEIDGSLAAAASLALTTTPSTSSKQQHKGGTGGKAAAAGKAIDVVPVEDAYHRATGIKRKLTVADQEIVNNAIGSGVPPAVLVTAICDVARREREKGNRIASFAYFHEPLAEAAADWHQGGSGSLRKCKLSKPEMDLARESAGILGLSVEAYIRKYMH